MTVEWTTPTILEWIKNITPVMEVKENAFDSSMTRVIFPAPANADYRFEVHVYENDEIQIAARLLEQPDAYFWYTCYELCSMEPITLLTERFLKTLKKVLLYPTRIEQKRGWLCWNFDCSYCSGTTWEKIVGVGCLRASYDDVVPQISGKQRFYHASPYSPDNNGVRPL